MQKPMTTFGVVSLACVLSAAPLSWQDGSPVAPAAPSAPAKQDAPAKAPKAPDGKKAGSASGTGSGGKAAKEPKKIRPAGVWYGVEKAPEKKAGAIRIAAYNVENLFDAVD